MKMQNDTFYFLRYISLAVVFMSGIVTIIASNGDGNGDQNFLLSGDYQIHKVEFEGSSFYAESFDGSADGLGSFYASVQTFEYSISSDRTMSISVPSEPTIEDEYGIVSSDGSLAIITDAQFIDPNTQNDVETALIVRKSTNMTLSQASGEFIVSQIGQDAQGFYTSQVEVVLQGDGTGTWLILKHSVASEIGDGGTFTYIVATDGTFTVDKDPVIDIDSGIISPDANVFVMTDSNINDGDGETYFAVGVRKSITPPDLSGSYQLTFIGYDVTNTYPLGPQFAARWDAVEDASNLQFNATAIVDSRGTTPGTTVTIPHTTVANDGTFDANVYDLSIVSPDGEFFAIVETDITADAEIKIGLAIR